MPLLTLMASSADHLVCCRSGGGCLAGVVGRLCLSLKNQTGRNGRELHVFKTRNKIPCNQYDLPPPLSCRTSGALLEWAQSSMWIETTKRYKRQEHGERQFLCKTRCTQTSRKWVSFSNTSNLPLLQSASVLSASAPGFGSVQIQIWRVESEQT